MKIAVIGPTYPYKGGISHFTTLLVQHLRNNNKVDFISWKRQYPSFLYPVEPKDTESKMEIKEQAAYLLDYLNPLTWFSTFLYIKKKKPDKLIITWVSPVQSPIYFIINLLIKIFSGIKILFVCHNVLPHEGTFLDKPLARIAFLLGDEFMVHSKEDKEKLEKLTKGKKIILGFHPIYDVFNTGKIYNTKNIKQELGLRKKVLLFFGYIRPYKGLKYLIKAMPLILKKYPDTSLLVVGEFWSKDKESYFNLVNDLELKKDIVFVDSYVPNEEVGKYFTLADVVVLPYVSATQSGIIPIAFSFNKPVISTRVGGLADVMEDNKTGLFINKSSSGDIVNKIDIFYSCKRNKFDKGISILKNKLSWKIYTSFIENV